MLLLLLLLLLLMLVLPSIAGVISTLTWTLLPSAVPVIKVKCDFFRKYLIIYLIFFFFYYSTISWLSTLTWSLLPSSVPDWVVLANAPIAPMQMHQCTIPKTKHTIWWKLRLPFQSDTSQNLPRHPQIPNTPSTRPNTQMQNTKYLSRVEGRWWESKPPQLGCWPPPVPT